MEGMEDLLAQTVTGHFWKRRRLWHARRKGAVLIIDQSIFLERSKGHCKGIQIMFRERKNTASKRVKKGLCTFAFQLVTVSL